MSGRLATRFYAVGAVLGVLLTGSFLVLLLAIDDLRDTSEALVRSEERVTVASRTLRRAVDLETGLRGLVLTGDESFLDPAQGAQAQLPPILRDLLRLYADEPAGAARARAAAEEVRDYERYIARQIAAGPDRPRTELLAAAEEGKGRLDVVRRALDSLIDDELVRIAELEHDADATADRARIIGIITFLLLLAAVPAALLYLLRVVVAPVRAVGEAAQRLAGGEPQARAPEGGAGEVAALARSFNSMAAALEVSRAELETRGVRLGETNEQLRAALQDLERSKAQAILELSTPVLQLSTGLLVLPIIGALDLERARQIDGRLLAEVRERRAGVVVIDVTGVPEIDTPVAGQLQRTVAAVGLLGARVIMTGISGELADALVALDVQFSGLDSFADLQSGVEWAARRR